MNSSRLLVSVLLVTLAAYAGNAASEFRLPRQLEPAQSSSSQTLVARGAQIYKCRAASDRHAPTQWTWVAPEAVGGAAPTAPCTSRTASGPIRVPYSAGYLFFIP